MRLSTILPLSLFLLPLPPTILTQAAPSPSRPESRNIQSQIDKCAIDCWDKWLSLRREWQQEDVYPAHYIVAEDHVRDRACAERCTRKFSPASLSGLKVLPSRQPSELWREKQKRELGEKITEGEDGRGRGGGGGAGWGSWYISPLKKNKKMEMGEEEDEDEEVAVGDERTVATNGNRNGDGEGNQCGNASSSRSSWFPWLTNKACNFISRIHPTSILEKTGKVYRSAAAAAAADGGGGGGDAGGRLPLSMLLQPRFRGFIPL
ncbi:MAG: hypothetical protein M1816_005383 [Peltula sp. TS41687]|nr:MAG: hypothetical protein M1816_005383 [Peltula sp. TS41687]